MSISLITVYNIFNCVHIWTLHRLNCRSNTQHWRYANIQMQAKIPKTHTFPPEKHFAYKFTHRNDAISDPPEVRKTFSRPFRLSHFPSQENIDPNPDPPDDDDHRTSASIAVFRESIFRAGQFIYENWQLRSCGSQLCGLPPTNGFLSVWFMTVSRRSHLQPAKMLLISTSWWSVYSAVAAVKHSSKPKIDLLHALDHNLLECCLL